MLRRADAGTGTDTEEREKAAQITSAEGRLLVEIDAAHARISSDAYGVCATCGGEIGVQRLEAVPCATQDSSAPGTSAGRRCRSGSAGCSG